MTRNSYVAFVVLAAAFSLQLAPDGRLALSAAYAESENLRGEVSKPLQAAQDLIKAKKYKAALAKIHDADAVPNKTAYERFILERMRGAAAMAAGEEAVAAKSFDTVINSGRLPAQEQLKIIEAMAGAYYRAKDYGKAVTWYQRYLKMDEGNPQMRTLLIQAQYLSGDYAAVARELSAEFQADDKAGRVPPEERMKLLGDSYAQMNDNAGYVSVLERLVAHYPRKEYWADLLARLQRKPGFADRLTLDLFRLQMATGSMISANNYIEMAQLALQAGFPAEAKQVVDKGFESGVLGNGPEADRHKRLKELVNKQVAEDQKTLGEGDAQAEAAKTGGPLVNTGYHYVTNGKFEKGVAMMEAGIAKGGLKRPEDDKLHLGFAYLQAGNRVKAIQVLRTVQGNDGTAELAHLWTYVR